MKTHTQAPDFTSNEPAHSELFLPELRACRDCGGSGWGHEFADRDEHGPFVNADPCDGECEGHRFVLVQTQPAGEGFAALNIPIEAYAKES